MDANFGWFCFIKRSPVCKSGFMEIGLFFRGCGYEWWLLMISSAGDILGDKFGDIKIIID